jgi:tRNA threonylcarbamoyladenosine biosynthesis protein TsaE
VKVQTHSAAETHAIGRQLGTLVQGGDVIVLAGDLGAGKTVFAKGLAAGMGVEVPVVSPTFTIVREYQGRLPLVHLDVYRLHHLQELHDLGFEELVDASRVTVIEWGDVVVSQLPPDRLDVRIEHGAPDAEDDRWIVLGARGARWADRLAELERRVAAGDR